MTTRALLPPAVLTVGVRVELLGVLRLTVDEVVVDVRGLKRRSLLALLALAGSRAVSVATLTDELWPEELPASSRAALQSHISRLRAQLGPAAARLETLEGGYRLRLGAEELDVTQTRRLLSDGRRCANQGRPAHACRLLREALALWRGSALSDVAASTGLDAWATTLTHVREDVTDLLISCSIAAAELDEVVALAQQNVAADPLREPAAMLLCRALAATGRAPEALAAARSFRSRLAEETGLDPSPALADLERDIASGASGEAHGGLDVRGLRRTGATAVAGTTSGGAATTSRRPPRLPAVTTRLIGRQAAVATVQRLLTSSRLVTLVGPGGVGKTRVALEVARRAPLAVVLELASVTDEDAIPYALAAALELRVEHGDVLRTCCDVLGDEARLLVLDNCEHLLDAVRDVADHLLGSCADLTVLATSREPLGVSAESTMRLAPLSVPSAHHELAFLPTVSSVAVFVERAGRVRPGFVPTADELPVIADVVRRLDGMPLAIELAAGRLSSFTVTELHERLDRSLDLLSGGQRSSDVRHRTLRATVDWSYDLLSEDERRLFRRLAVFSDGIDLADAELLAAGLTPGGDAAAALAHLVDTSMVEASFAEGSTRFRLLETLRTYGLDRLETAGETAEARSGLTGWALGLLERIDTLATSEREADADAALRRELGNVRSVWRQARDAGDLSAAAAVVTRLCPMAMWRDLAEVAEWAFELAADPVLTGHPRAAAVLGAAANFAYRAGDSPRADELGRAGLSVAVDDEGQWFCHSALAQTAFNRAAYDEAIASALAARAAAPQRTGNLGVAALAAVLSGDIPRAHELTDAMCAEVRSPTLRGFGAYLYGSIASAAGDLTSAESHFSEALELARTSGATFLGNLASTSLQGVRVGAGHIDDALRGYGDVVEHWATAGNWGHLWFALRGLADLLQSLGDAEAAGPLHAAAANVLDAERPDRAPPVSPLTRTQALELARQSIARHVGQG